MTGYKERNFLELAYSDGVGCVTVSSRIAVVDPTQTQDVVILTVRPVAGAVEPPMPLEVDCLAK